MVVAHAIAQVDGERRGIHVLFSGPPGWIYAPDGWDIERRVWQRPDGPRVCADLKDAALSELRRERELETPIGIATLRPGTWVHPATGIPGTADVLTIDLTTPTTLATVAMPGPNWTAYGLRAGKVVAGGPAQTLPGQVILTASAIDSVVVHAQHADSFRVCTVTDLNTTSGWTAIAHLQLPLRELDLSLADDAAEWNRASGQLISGDALDEPTFAELASALRPVAPAPGGERPIDRSIRPDPDNPNTILGALDPLRLALLDPVIRRALGMAHFDGDPALELGAVYQYRVSAKFPPDAALPRGGFQTVPVGTHVPADFFLGDVHVRLAQPSQVELAPTGAVGDVVVGRRAIAIRPRQSPYWLLPDLLDAALVLDFATPRSSVVLDLADPVDLHYDAFDADGVSVGGGDPGDGVLTFSAPSARVVLHGQARWFGLRDVVGGTVAMTALTAPVVLAEPAPPPAPLSITVTTAGTSTQSTADAPQPRSPLGFDVAWRPPLAFGTNAWPPDAAAAPPLEATRFELEHEQLGEGFTPVFGPGGQAFGDRSTAGRAPVTRGADLMVLFPEQPPPPVGAADEFTIRDEFLRDPEIPAPQPGTEHRYRVRSLDEIGRPSTWLTSAPGLLEKRFPPPVPVGPPSPGGPGRVAGVRARVLVRDAPDLTPGEEQLLDQDGSTTAIVLTWGWTDDQRSLDLWTREFRVYKSSGGIGPVRARVTAATEIGAGRFTAQLTLDRAVGADAARGGYLPAGGEYRILGHDAGLSIQATVETLVPAEDGTFPPPRLGPTILPVPLAAAQSRPDAWEQRIDVVPLTDEAVYEIVLRDIVLPTADTPSAAVWLAVSAADAEPYVADAFPGGGRPGNESPLVAVRCEARYHGRPDLSVPPPIGDVPAVVTARATFAGVEHDLDLLPYLAGTGLVSGELVAVEQLSDGDVLAALRVDGTDVVAVPPPTAPPDAGDVTIAVPNPDDRAAIVAALTNAPLSIADRYVVFLAARHPYADWLFTLVPPATHVLGQPVRFSLAAGGCRYVARVRRVDAAGNRSAGAATCAVVVRVPAFAPLAPPAFLGARWTTTADGLRVELRAAVLDERATHLLTWIAATDPRRAQLATVGSRRDLPGFGIRLRALDGASLTPSVAAVEGGDAVNGARLVTTVEDVAAGPHFVWLAVVDGDGVPSRLAGAFRLPPRVA